MADSWNQIILKFVAKKFFLSLTVLSQNGQHLKLISENILLRSISLAYFANAAKRIIDQFDIMW